MCGRLVEGKLRCKKQLRVAQPEKGESRSCQDVKHWSACTVQTCELLSRIQHVQSCSSARKEPTQAGQKAEAVCSRMQPVKRRSASCSIAKTGMSHMPCSRQQAQEALQQVLMIISLSAESPSLTACSRAPRQVVVAGADAVKLLCILCSCLRKSSCRVVVPAAQAWRRKLVQKGT